MNLAFSVSMLSARSQRSTEARSHLQNLLLEVDDHLMGAQEMHTMTQLLDRSVKVDMTRFIQERLRPISLQKKTCLDKSAEASEGEVKALRAVARSLSWIVRAMSA